MTDYPERPLLARHVLARRYRREDGTTVVLFDERTGERPVIGARTYAIVAALDGSRDVEGLMAYAERDGVRVSRAELTELLAELGRAGMLEAAPPLVAPSAGRTEEPGERAAEPDPIADAELPIEQLTGFALACDGRGTCCRFYPTILFSPLETARARAAAPDVMDGGDRPMRVFLPVRGNEPGARAVALDHGRCAYLEPGGGCGIHRQAGAAHKPLGCRTYPARFVSDGATVRVTPWLECACVFASGTREDGPPHGAATLTEATTSAGLAREIFVEQLPGRVLLSPGREVAREHVANESKRWAAEVQTDGVRSLLALRSTLRGEPPRAPQPHDVLAQLEALRGPLAHLASEPFRSGRDLVRITAAALREALELATAEPEALLSGPGAFAADERFYVTTALFGHHLVPRKPDRTLSHALWDRAGRLVLGRALGVVANLAELGDPAFAHPLALVDATLRGYGLGRRLANLAEP